MSINMGSIMRRVNAYAKSDDGKKKQQECIDDLIKSRKTTTASGQQLLSLHMMEQAARELANEIIRTASKYELPDSVMKNIRSLSSTKPYLVSDGQYRVDLFFTDDLSRESLYDDGYDGVVNIIALFNNGYVAKDYVYGFWDGHEPDGRGKHDPFRSDYANGDFVYIRSLDARPELRLMQEAVSDFKAKFGKKYNCTIKLDDIYEEETW